MSYHPITLTSALGKLFQKTRLSFSQYSFHKGRNSLQALSDRNLQIHEAMRSNSNLYTIFFDLQEDFSHVWHHHICSKLYDIGLKGHLPNLLQSFLYDRSLTVRIGDQLNGVPQGEVWSVPLFMYHLPPHPTPLC